MDRGTTVRHIQRQQLLCGTVSGRTRPISSGTLNNLRGAVAAVPPPLPLRTTTTTCLLLVVRAHRRKAPVNQICAATQNARPVGREECGKISRAHPSAIFSFLICRPPTKFGGNGVGQWRNGKRCFSFLPFLYFCPFFEDIPI
ncbi:hypothetical protein niasHS_008697 [Heterodera schachtii]|uniref:Uncharacterized protein n=1 Tax=Heterodera schachtii TaxID=97005 RepID=A0ABD2JAT5_HETSC